MAGNFIHLHLHTEYSIVDSIVTADSMVAACIKAGMPAVAITDQSNLFGLIKFYKAAIAAGIKPIIGVEIWLANNLGEEKLFRVVLLAQNQIGYQNIIKIISLSYTDGQRLGVPIVCRNWLEEFSAGIIVLSGGKEGDLGQALLSGNQELAFQIGERWQKFFPNRFYIELHRTGRVNEENYLQAALEFAEQQRFPVVATNDVRFVTPNDFEAHEARVCINAGYVLTDPNRPKNYSDQQFFRTEDEMAELFADIPEALHNTVEIAKRCNVELTLGKSFLPIFPVPKETTVEIYFETQTQAGLEERLKTNNTKREVYDQRLNYEIRVIKQMGFSSYFLIVADFIQWAKNQGIPVGPGRGSGAGSLVAYSLKITDLDPIEHELLFERFLNPERISMPDFDVDFCMDGRDRVIEYVSKRYGKERVAQIITYGTMAARAVVRDVGRVLGYGYGFVDKIAKLIPFELGISLEKALQDEELLQQRYQKEEEVKTLLDLALKLEGITRNAGKHAGGVVIAPSVLTDFTPLYCEAEGEGLVTQFDKNDVEAVGLVKFDFLGLRTLTIINWAQRTINENLDKNQKTKIDISRISLSDEKTYQLFRACNTTAVFQLESRSTRDLIKRLQPGCFNDIIALQALIRPGPQQSGMVDEFMERKDGRSKVSYLHPKLEPILQQTYGVILYQEQVMQIAQTLAGYTLGQADILRSAMGKKKAEEMAKQRVIFLQGSVANGIDKHIANTIFDLMEKFAGYGFNKSHSAAYALITYQTAWLKAHYPAEFMAAVLSSDMDNTDKVVLFLEDCKLLGLKIIPPDINLSCYHFTVNSNGEIIYGLGAIKGIGLSAVESIIASRNESGNFKNLFDFCKRVDGRKVNRRVLEALICSGALDGIGPHRASLVESIPMALQTAEQQLRAKKTGQLDLFAAISEELPDTDENYVASSEWSNEERLSREKSVLGFYLCGHPIEKYQSELNKIVSCKIAELSGELSIVKIAGFVTGVRIVTTKSGKKLAIITIEDETGTIDVTMFSELFTKVRNLLVEDQLIIVEGEVSVDMYTQGYRVRATSAMDLEQARAVFVRGLLLKLTPITFSQDILERLNPIFSDYKNGNCPVVVIYKNNDATVKLALGDAWKIQPKECLLSQLRHLLGDENVKFCY